MDIPIKEPTQITAGDSVTWVRTLRDYPASLGWTLHYVLLSQGKNPITVDGTASDDDHLITLPAATTKGYAPANYRWTSYVTNGTDRITLTTGAIQVLPDPTKADNTFDPRSENQTILDAITAVLAGELTNPLAKYRIGGREGREVERHSRMELLHLQAIYRQRVAVETGQAQFFGAIPIKFQSDFGIPGGSYGQG